MKLTPSIEATLAILADTLTYDSRSGANFHGFIGECDVLEDGLLYQSSAAMPRAGINPERLQVTMGPDGEALICGFFTGHAVQTFEHTHPSFVKVLEILRYSTLDGGLRGVDSLVREIIDPVEKRPEWAHYVESYGDLVSAAWFKRPCEAFDGRRPVDLMRDDSSVHRLDNYLQQRRLRSVM